jgi:cytochrome c oxidase subunit 2
MINEMLGMQPVASEHGAQLDFMLELLHWFVIVLFIPWSAFFIYCIFRFRKSRHPKASYAGVQGHGYKFSEVAVCIVEAILLLGFAIPLWAHRVNEFPPQTNATVVRVVGEQFAWNVHYAGPDGKLGRTDPKLVSAENPLGLDRTDENCKDDFFAINQMHLPVDRNVIVYLSSKDVVHSFKLLSMRICQDAIPGMSIPTWFKPIKTGTFEIVCAQLCGLGHYKMRGVVTVDKAEDFDRWIVEQSAKAKAGGGGGQSYE